MTGAYLRVKRNDRFENIEVEYLTKDELNHMFLSRPQEELVNWLALVCSKLNEAEKEIVKLNYLIDSNI